jgi:hypothetical protein
MSGQQVVRDVAYCPHCGNESQQQVNSSYSRYDPPGSFTNYVLVFCDTCKAPLLYQSDPDLAGQVNSGRKIARSDGFTLDDKILLWPKAGTLHWSVPERIRAVYEEAAAIKRRAPNAFANQIRRALEVLCHDRGANGRTLDASLRQLSANGEIPAPLADMTDVLRLFGNMGSHAAEVAVGPEHVYVAPNRVIEVRAQLDKLRNQSKSDA